MVVSLKPFKYISSGCHKLTVILHLLYLQDKFKANIIHKAAVFVNPRQKSMRALSCTERDQVTDWIGEEIDNLPLRRHQTTEDEAPPAKRSRSIDDFDDEPAGRRRIKRVHEVDNYRV